MHTYISPSSYSARFRRILDLIRFPLAMLVLSLVLTGCSAASEGVTSAPSDRDAALRQIAANYAIKGDLQAAQAALDELGLANPAQFVVSMAEADHGAGRPKEEIEPLARLANALGVRSPKLAAYLPPTLEPVAPTAALPTRTVPPPPTAVPPTATSAPPAATEMPPTATIEPTAVLPSATPPPQEPRVVAENSVNLRSGPGRAYPVIGRLNAGQEVDIVGRNASGDWWRLTWSGSGQAWVAGTVVRVLGAIDTVAEVADIPAPPTAAPQLTEPPAPPAPPTAAPKPAVDYRVIETRLLSIQENGGCMGNHNFYVQVVDAGGAPVNGAVIGRVWASNETSISGQKDCYWAQSTQGQGCGVFDVYTASDNLLIVADPALGSVVSETSRLVTTKDVDISVDELMGAGYCPEGRENCEWRKNPGGGMPPQLCNGHYSWFIKFQRTH